MNKPSIEEIKRLTESSAPYFFNRETLRCWGQTLKSFKVESMPDGRFKISAPSRYEFLDPEHAPIIGETVRYFNPLNNRLELE